MSSPFWHQTGVEVAVAEQHLGLIRATLMSHTGNNVESSLMPAQPSLLASTEVSVIPLWALDFWSRSMSQFNLPWVREPSWVVPSASTRPPGLVGKYLAVPQGVL